VGISLLSLGLQGLNLGIDFEGGTAWQFTVAEGSPSSSDVRDAIRDFGLAEAKVQIVGDDGVRVQAETLPRDEQQQVTEALADYADIDQADVSLSEVGPTWGDQVTEKAVRALVVFFALIALYLSFRLEWKMAVAALIAMVHDIIVTAGVYSVFGFEVTPATVVAFLTILGFSLYDTVVVFDKIRENTHTVGTVRGDTYSTMVNRSLNQVLIRSLNTSFVALLPVGSLLVVGSWIMGAVSLRDFALALFVGLLTGAYSSIFVATPIVAWWKEREPRYRAVRERAVVDIARGAARTPVAASVPTTARATAPPTEARDLEAPEPAVGVEDAPTTTSEPRPSPPAAPTRATQATPRPRQQRRRKRK
jgi:preprotein translocase subunit SecF